MTACDDVLSGNERPASASFVAPVLVFLLCTHTHTRTGAGPVRRPQRHVGATGCSLVDDLGLSDGFVDCSGPRSLKRKAIRQSLTRAQSESLATVVGTRTPGLVSPV